MGWRNAIPGDVWPQFVPLRSIRVLFQVHERTVKEWIARWAATDYPMRICYHPATWKGARALFHPELYVHIEDVIELARRDGFTIPEEVADDIRGRLLPEEGTRP